MGFEWKHSERCRERLSNRPSGDDMDLLARESRSWDGENENGGGCYAASGGIVQLGAVKKS